MDILENVVLKFVINNKNCIVIINNSTNELEYGDPQYWYFDYNKQLRNDFSNEELTLLNKIYQSILINKKTSIFVMKLNIVDVIYEIWYDYSVHLYYWYPINGKNNETINAFLNFLLNHNSSKYNLIGTQRNNDFNIHQKYPTKFIRLVLPFCVVFMLASCSISNFPERQLDNDIDAKHLELRMGFDDEDSMSGTFDKLSTYGMDSQICEVSYAEWKDKVIRRILENPDITGQGEKVLIEMVPIFREQLKYGPIDIEAFSRYKIIYVSDSSKTGALGNTDASNEVITVYNSDEKGNPIISDVFSSGEQHEDLERSANLAMQELYAHEPDHAFLQDNTKIQTADTYLECFAAEFGREVTRFRYDNGLIDEEVITDPKTNTPTRFGRSYEGPYEGIYYALKTLLSKEAINRYNRSLDSAYLEKELSKITGSIDDAKQLLSLWNVFMKYTKNPQLLLIENNIPIPMLESSLRYLYNKSVPEIMAQINKYHKAKYGYDLMADLNYVLSVVNSFPLENEPCEPFTDKAMQNAMKILLQELYGCSLDTGFGVLNEACFLDEIRYSSQIIVANVPRNKFFPFMRKKEKRNSCNTRN